MEPTTGAPQAEGLGETSIDTWLPREVPGLVPPLAAERLTGGHSNLTYVVEDAVGRTVVLRRPPLGTTLASAHDMDRERRILSALSRTDLPVPKILGWSSGDAGSPLPDFSWYVMEHVEGLVVRTPPQAEELLGAGARRHASDQVRGVLMQLHSLDPAAIGLGDLGRTSGYVPRQLRRWSGQLEKTRTPVDARFEELGERLGQAVPDERPGAVVHGDYKLDNLILDERGDIRAVLDWELCTLGDPLADVGLCLAYWGDKSRSAPAYASPSQAPGFLDTDGMRAAFADEYQAPEVTVHYFEAFGCWKIAAISHGVRARYLDGAYGDADYDAEAMDRRIDELLSRSAAHADRAGI